MSKVTFKESDPEFSRVLRTRVHDYFQKSNLPKQATLAAIFKAVFFVFAAVSIYTLLLVGHFPTGWVILLCLLGGCAAAGIGFNVMHDGVHGNFSTNPKWNTIMAHSMDLLGACSNFYKFQHTHVHHTYTNIPGHDADLEAGPILRFSPTQAYYPKHQFQHIYAGFLYTLVTIGWIWESDWRIYRTLKYCSYKMDPLTRKEKNLFFFFKAFHIAYAFILPMIYYPVLNVIGCYFLIHLTAGLILAHVFQMAHVFDQVSYPVPNQETNQISDGWFQHQLKTTRNFATTNRFLTHFIGGLNYQVEHHLFPRVHHIHYPALRPIVMQTCREFGVPYHEAATVREALDTHYGHLFALGRKQGSEDLEMIHADGR